jgi:hypothetical protein
MNSIKYLTQLKSYVEQYQDWKEPVKNAITKYLDEHKVFGKLEHDELTRMTQTLSERIQTENNLPERINSFLDQNYLEYLSFSQEECEVIILFLSGNSDFSGFLLTYTDRAISQLKSTGEESWLLRGLVAITLENCAVDYRDSLGSLADLSLAAKECGIPIKESFRKTALHASSNKPQGWHESMRKVMMGYVRDIEGKEKHNLKGKQ